MKLLDLALYFAFFAVVALTGLALAWGFICWQIARIRHDEAAPRCFSVGSFWWTPYLSVYNLAARRETEREARPRE